MSSSLTSVATKMDPEHAKNVGDVTAATVGILALANWLPPIAAGLTIVYTVMRIVEWVVNKSWKRKEQ